MRSSSQVQPPSNRGQLRAVLLRQVWRVTLATGLAVAAAGCAASVPEPDVDSLRASFIAQIQSNDLVQDLQVEGDEVRFAVPDGSGEDIDWRVRIDALDVEGTGEEGGQILGHVLSTWTIAGRPVSVEMGPQGLVTDMPHWVLDAGLAPECWALWDDEGEAWGWT